MKGYAEALIRLVFPETCGLCGNVPDITQRGLCGDCQQELDALARSPLEGLIETDSSSTEHIWSVYPYEGRVKDLLHAVKFAQKPWLLNNLMPGFDPFLRAVCGERNFDIVVPVPMSRMRRVERGYNQAELLAEKVSGLIHRPVSLAAGIDTAPGEPQRSLSREEREANVDGAFKVSRIDRVAGKAILLVDDIVTTGSTVEEISRLLRESGAASVDVITAASTKLEHEAVQA